MGGEDERGTVGLAKKIGKNLGIMRLATFQFIRCFDFHPFQFISLLKNDEQYLLSFSKALLIILSKRQFLDWYETSNYLLPTRTLCWTSGNPKMYG